MACNFPIPAYLGNDGAVTFIRKNAAAGRRGLVHLNCGMCRGCKADLAREWSIRAYHESQLHEQSIFATFTYSPDKLPPHGTLDPRDLQLFFKRLRKSGVKFRYFACGEYGEKTNRAHYHACLFGYDPEDGIPITRSASGNLVYQSPKLTKHWSLGHVSYGPFHPDAARYTAHYTAKKLKKYALDHISDEGLKPYERLDKTTGHIIELKHEFQRQSTKPPLGIPWLEKNWREVFPADSVVMAGKQYPVPRAYWLWLKENQRQMFHHVKRKRLEYIKDRPYISGHRLHQMEVCKDQKLNRLERPHTGENTI